MTVTEAKANGLVPRLRWVGSPLIHMCMAYGRISRARLIPMLMGTFPAMGQKVAVDIAKEVMADYEQNPTSESTTIVQLDSEFRKASNRESNNWCVYRYFNGTMGFALIGRFVYLYETLLQFPHWAQDQTIPSMKQQYDHIMASE